jgi:hypothetical protein
MTIQEERFVTDQQKKFGRERIAGPVLFLGLDVLPIIVGIIFLLVDKWGVKELSF